MTMGKAISIGNLIGDNWNRTPEETAFMEKREAVRKNRLIWQQRQLMIEDATRLVDALRSIRAGDEPYNEENLRYAAAARELAKNLALVSKLLRNNCRSLWFDESYDGIAKGGEEKFPDPIWESKKEPHDPSQKVCDQIIGKMSKEQIDSMFAASAEQNVMSDSNAGLGNTILRAIKDQEDIG